MITAAYSNAGTVRNRGYEFSASWDDNAGDFRYGVRLTGTSNKNKILDFQGQTVYSGDWMVPSTHISVAGIPIGNFYGYKSAGIAQSQQQIDQLDEKAASVSGVAGKQYWSGLKPGDLLFQDLNGDGFIDVKDKADIGSPHPKFVAGITLTGGYKGFDFTADLMGSYGNKINNSDIKMKINIKAYIISAPARPSVINGNGQVQLSWPTVEGAVTYAIKRSNSAQGPYVELVNGLTTNSYIDQGLSNGTRYHYVVSARGSSKQSADSEEMLGLPGATLSVWKASPATKIWSDATNWEGAVPASPAVIYLGASESTSVLQNDLSGLAVARITFSDSAYHVTGNPITLSDGVENSSTKAQLLQMPVSLSSDVQLNTTGNLRFEGLIDGSHAIHKKGSGTLLVQGLNAYSGGTVVQVGMVRVSGGQDGSALGPLGSGPVTLKDGAALGSTERINSFLPNDITVEGNVYIWNGWESDYLKLNGKLKGSGTITYDGSSYSGLDLNGDNSEFTGSFRAIRRSSPVGISRLVLMQSVHLPQVEKLLLIRMVYFRLRLVRSKTHQTN